jgi:hypothetical protein
MTTLLSVAGGTVFLGTVVAVLLYLPVRRSLRRSRTETDAILAQMEADLAATPPLPPYEPLLIPEGPPPAVELRITFQRQPGADSEELAGVAARLIREADRLERAYGGDGLDYDEAGSVEEADHVTFRLVPIRADWEAEDRLERLADQMRRLIRRGREGAARRETQDILGRVDRKLHPPLPPAIIQDVVIAVGVREPDLSPGNALAV